MEALVVIDAQNEFGPLGQRAVEDHDRIVATIMERIREARAADRPIAFIRHHNLPGESSAFQPGSWGADYSNGIGPSRERRDEAEFVKHVFGAFSGTPLGQWLDDVGASEVLLVGFYTHMCVSTTAREAVMRGLHVAIDPDGTAAAQLKDESLGEQSADEVRRTALLQLTHMGVRVRAREESALADVVTS
jgi:nicotinamidase-related amidase